ncbi:aspartate/glutamate racemase family protein [Allopusillimonas ginsengisoli]|uniref:aspartate/glutamate racemase family protein n=1 Tax=Allopusillimonas ginsengisoli TaxID=453575 RepID=UPI00102285F5|nr:amino acid racemase [Allopusillimonas ginsengisoli]TEA79779.1 aspartate/glutamate racemase family protein [Allopusillimonas ginsengisoli]
MDISALNHTCHEGRFLGVLGGMGPMAGASFMARLVALSNADCDQQHLPAILWSDPRIPGRSKGYAKLGPDPLPWMMHGVNRLVSMGAGAIAIPCNTAHLWYEQISAAVQVPVLHIVQAVIDDLRRQGIHQGCVGLMGTSATLRLGLYQRALEKNGYRWMMPTETEIADYCSASITLVGANRIAEALKPAAECVSILKSRGADVVVLGCTELPLALPHPIRPGLGIPIVDSIDALALAAMDWY